MCERESRVYGCSGDSGGCIGGYGRIGNREAFVHLIRVSKKTIVGARACNRRVYSNVTGNVYRRRRFEGSAKTVEGWGGGGLLLSVARDLYRVRALEETTDDCVTAVADRQNSDADARDPHDTSHTPATACSDNVHARPCTQNNNILHIIIIL